MISLQQADAFDARHLRQSDVHQSHVREVPANTLDGQLHRFEAAATAETRGAVDEHAQALPDPGLIFHDGDFEHSGIGHAGRGLAVRAGGPRPANSGDLLAYARSPTLTPPTCAGIVVRRARRADRCYTLVR